MSDPISIPDFKVQITAAAREDLKDIGFLTRRLIRQAIIDELRTEDPSLPTRQLAEGGSLLQVGPYQVRFESEQAETGEPLRTVLGVRQGDLAGR
jgi:hypothetical protein